MRQTWKYALPIQLPDSDPCFLMTTDSFPNTSGSESQVPVKASSHLHPVTPTLILSQLCARNHPKFSIQPGGFVVCLSRHHLGLNPASKWTFRVSSNLFFDNVPPPRTVPLSPKSVIFNFGHLWSSPRDQIQGAPLGVGMVFVILFSL